MTDASWPIEADLFAELPEAVGNITFTPSRDVIFSHHPFFEPDIRVAKLDAARTSSTPWPNAEWNRPRDGTDRYLDSVLGLRCDGRGVVWMLDMGTRGGLTPKLVGWDSNRDALHRILYVPAPASLPESQHNDFTIDETRGLIVIADEGIGPGGDGTQAALVVVDMATGATRRVLQGHESCLPEDVPLRVGDRVLTVDEQGTPLRIGADGIVADLAFDWLYFGPLSGGWIYHVRLDDLADESLSETELGQRVERYAEKPNNGGLSIDRDGNLYLTAVESTAVGIIPADTRAYAEYAAHPDLIWPDGVSYAGDGYMYVSASQVSEGADFNDGEDRTEPPYRIFRFPPLAPGRLGY